MISEPSYPRFPFYKKYYDYTHNPYQNMQNPNITRDNIKQQNPKKDNFKKPEPVYLNETKQQPDLNLNKSFNIFGIELHFDDILIVCLLLFLYSEGVKDPYVFIALILLLLS